MYTSHKNRRIIIKSVFFFLFVSRILDKQRRGKLHDSHMSALAGKSFISFYNKLNISFFVTFL